MALEEIRGQAALLGRLRRLVLKNTGIYSFALDKFGCSGGVYSLSNNL